MRTALLAIILFVQGPTLLAPQARGTVTGRLLNPDGSPAVAIRVSAMSVPEPGRSELPALSSLTETDTSGRYRLENVMPGRYYIVAGLIDTQTYYPGVRTAIEATVVDVTSTTPAALGDFYVLRASTGLAIRGRVIRDANQPLGGPIQINLVGGDQYLNVTAKTDGSFEFARVRPGTYTMSLNSAAGPESKSVTVADKDVEGIDFILPWTVDVSGTISVEGAGLQPNISVSFVRGGQENQVGGRQSFRRTLAEGVYGVVVSSLPNGYYVKSISAGSTDLTKEPIRLSRLVQPPNINIVLGVSSPAPWVRVAGRVRGANVSAPLTITLTGRNVDVLESPVSPDGSFEFPRILPGTYSLSLRPTSVPMPTLSLTVPNANFTALEIQIPPTTEVSGRVTVEDGGPLPRLYFSMTGDFSVERRDNPTDSAITLGQLLFGRANNVRSATTLNVQIQPDGTFKTTLPQGEYRLNVTPANAGSNNSSVYSVKRLTYGTSDVRTADVKVGVEPAELRVLLAPVSPNAWSKVSGRVLGFTPDFGEVTISLNSQAYLSPLTIPVKADGTFEFARVYPGTYTVTAVIRGPSISAPNSFNGAPSVVPFNLDVAAKDITGIEIKIVQRKEISGRLRIEGPGPLIRLQLPLAPAASRNVPFNNQGPLSINPQPDGSFKSQVFEWEYQLGQADLPYGYALKSVTFGSTDLTRNPLKVAVNDNTELTVVVAAPPRKPVRVAGHVRGFDGASLPLDSVTATLNSSFYLTSPQAIVGADRSFEFLDVFPGQYNLSLSRFNNVPRTTVLVSDTDIKDLEIVVPGQKEIFGRVVVEGNAPLPRLNFQAIPSGGAVSSPTFLNINPRADGTFSVTVTEGDWQLQPPRGLPGGYALKSIAYGAVDLISSLLKVNRNDASQLLVTVTASGKPVKVSGRTQGLDEAALARSAARVTLTPAEFAVSPAVPVKPDGTFEFPDVFPGNYQARVTGVPTGNPPGLAVVVGNTDVSNLLLVVPAQKAVSGRIEVAPGGVIPRLSMEVMTSDGRGSASGSIVTLNPQTDGTFRVTLPEGEHRLRIAQVPPGYDVSSFTHGTVDLLKAPVKISPTDAIEPLRIHLTANGTPPPWVRVSGRVLEHTSILRAVRMSLAGGAQYLESPVGEDGRFEFTQVLPGTYTLLVTASIGGSPPAPKVVAVGNTDVRDIEVSLRRPAVVRGRIVVDEGVTAPWLTIDARNRAGQVASSALANGAFVMTLDEDEHRVSIRDLPLNYAVRSMLYGATDLRTQPMKPAASEAEIILMVAGPATNAIPGFRIRGRVNGALQRLPQPGKLIVAGPSPIDVREIPIASDGRFVIEGAHDGTYSLHLSGLGSSVVSPKSVVVAGKNIDRVDIKVPSEITIAGNIVVEGGRQLTAATAVVAEAAYSTGVYTGIAAADGSFKLLLPEGRQTLTVRGLPANYRVQSVRYKSKRLKDGRFEVKASDSDAKIEIIVTEVTVQ